MKITLQKKYQFMTQKHLLKKILLKYTRIMTKRKVLLIEANPSKDFAMLTMK